MTTERAIFVTGVSSWKVVDLKAILLSSLVASTARRAEEDWPLVTIERTPPGDAVC